MSSLLLLEAAMESALKMGSYPTVFVRQVMEDVPTVVAEGKEGETDTTESNTLSVLYLTVTKLCKV